MGESKKETTSQKCEKASCQFKIAELPDACKEKIHTFEQELNKQGFWNISLVAYREFDS